MLSKKLYICIFVYFFNFLNQLPISTYCFAIYKLFFSLLLLVMEITCRGAWQVEKIELITRIRALSELLHSDDLHKYSFSEETLTEMKQKLDEITEEYIAAYC